VRRVLIRAMMTMLLLYATGWGIVSSRRSSAACTGSGLSGVDGQTSSRTTTRISEFRSPHLDSLRGLFVQILAPVPEGGLLSLGHAGVWTAPRCRQCLHAQSHEPPSACSGGEQLAERDQCLMPQAEIP